MFKTGLNAALVKSIRLELGRNSSKMQAYGAWIKQLPSTGCKTRELIAIAVAITTLRKLHQRACRRAARAGAISEIKGALATAIALNAGAAYTRFALRALET